MMYEFIIRVDRNGPIKQHGVHDIISHFNDGCYQLMSYGIVTPNRLTQEFVKERLLDMGPVDLDTCEATIKHEYRAWLALLNVLEEHV